ncbi:hypothetical protein IAT40_001888 [Kwoniella sp. CBS 6097]
MLNNEQNGDDFATRQARLQKTLATAYLSHQIAELESQVKATSLTTPAPSDPRTGSGIKPSATAQQVQKPKANRNIGRIDVDVDVDVEGQIPDPNDDLGRPDDVDDESEHGDDDWRVVVVDASALMWAKNAVKRLVGKGWEVIVPLEALRTLDLLKKGSSPSAVTARQATRYIEHAARFHSLLSSDPSLTVQLGTNYKKGRGLRLQREEETRPVNSMIDELALPPMDGDGSMPIWVLKTFSCVAFFKRIMDKEMEMAVDDGLDREIGPILYVGNPPVFVEVEQGRNEPTPSGGRDADRSKDADYAARGEGHFILEEAARFDLTLEVLRDDDVEVEASGLGRNRGRGNKGRNGGGGGGGGGGGSGDRERNRKGKEGGKGRSGRGEGRKDKDKDKDKGSEPEREVRILLRRPPSPNQGGRLNGNGHGEGSHPSPESGRSTLLNSGNSPAMPGSQLKPSINPPVMGILARPPPPPPSMGHMRGPPPPGGPPPPPPHHHMHGPSPSHPHGPPPPAFGHRPPPPPSGRPPPPPMMHHPHHPHGRPPPPSPHFHDRPLPHDPPHHRQRGNGSGSGGGGRNRVDRRGGGGPKPSGGDFVLLQRPESLVRHVPAPSPGSGGPTANATARLDASQADGRDKRRDEGRSRGRGNNRPNRLDEPKVVLLQRPK